MGVAVDRVRLAVVIGREVQCGRRGKVQIVRGRVNREAREGSGCDIERRTYATEAWEEGGDVRIERERRGIWLLGRGPTQQTASRIGAVECVQQRCILALASGRVERVAGVSAGVATNEVREVREAARCGSGLAV